MGRIEHDRPPRRAIPVSVKRAVVARQKGICPCGCGQEVSERPRTNTVFDHVPPLRQRTVNAAGTDYEPPQHSAEHIDAVCRAESDVRTFRGRGAAGRSDATENARERRREKERAGIGKPKSKWGSRPLKGGGGFPPKGSRPMRKKT